MGLARHRLRPPLLPLGALNGAASCWQRHDRWVTFPRWLDVGGQTGKSEHGATLHVAHSHDVLRLQIMHRCCFPPSWPGNYRIGVITWVLSESTAPGDRSEPRFTFGVF